MKTNYTTIIAAIILAAGIAILGFSVKDGIDNMAFRDRQVTVKGLAEREVEANHVIWPLQYSVAGDNLISLYDKVTAYNNVITQFLTSNGIDKSEISINPPETYDAQTNQYSSGNFRYNYSLSCTVTVNTTKVDKVRELLNRQSDLLKEGIPCSNSYINYEYTSLNQIKPDMIAEATKNARAAAAQFAEDSDSKIGKMKSASQGQFSIDDTSSSTPWMKKVRVVSTITYYLKD